MNECLFRAQALRWDESVLRSDSSTYHCQVTNNEPRCWEPSGPDFIVVRHTHVYALDCAPAMPHMCC